MSLAFTGLDWLVVAAYIAALAIAALLSSRDAIQSADAYFLAGQKIPVWLVAISVLSTTQSAATFLGGPDYGYRGDFTYVTSFLGALFAAFLVSRVLIPRFYAIGATTVYELLDQRYGVVAKQAAGAMYLVGRVFASGARLYLAAIAVSMMIFLEVSAVNIVLASLVLLIFGLVFTYAGGLKSIIWSDVVQVVIYVGAAIFTLFFLIHIVPASVPEIIAGLAETPQGINKLQFFNLSTGLSEPFSLIAIFTGVTLLYAGNFGLDQDTTQRLLACRDAREASRALYASVLIAIPVVMVFVSIGHLLYVFYDRPELMASTGRRAAETSFQGEKITVFMSFILSQIPPGLRGLVTVGVIAAAAINSGINSMASVFVEDFYRPWRERAGPRSEAHYLSAGKVSMVVMGILMFAMSVLCYFWQRYANTPLLEFALSVMTFAYSGLLGVYITAVFTQRGSQTSVLAALAVGFMTILMFQGYVIDAIGLPMAMKAIAFPWQLCIGTALSTLTCLLGTNTRQPLVELRP
jgi:solute:Na+ symporter, SSS family